MIITFDPMINSASTSDAAMMNFLRCVTAAATAAAGTTSLTVNPFVNNTGTIDNTKNCIISIDANAEAGGWTTSSAHTVVNSGAFTGFTSNMKAYLADFYVASGKSAQPYLKFTVSAPYLSGGTVYATAASGLAAATWNTTGYAPVVMTFGSSTSSALGGDANYHTTAFPITTTDSCFTSGGFGSVNATVGAAIAQSMMTGPAMTTVLFKMAVTKDYCIIWDTAKANNWTSGYGNVLNGTIANAYTHTNWTYGSILYGGLRETQPWEDAMNNNPPWAHMFINHTTKSVTGYTDSYAAYIATKNNAGVATTTPTLQWTNGTYASVLYNFFAYLNTYSYSSYAFTTYFNDDYRISKGLDAVPFQLRDTSGSALPITFSMPVTDDTTGALVPCAKPIIFSRSEENSWNTGGPLRGLYKSLDMPYTLMKSYFSDGQTFTVNGEPYMPIVFNETMYLVRFK